MNLGEREAPFWARVQVTPTCWLWTGSINRKTGYGRCMLEKKYFLVHRLSWTVHCGSIPFGLCVLHHCDIKNCIRPEHLFLGTRGDNNRDRHQKGRTAAGPNNGLRKHPDRSPAVLYPELFKGERNGRAVLTEETVQFIRRIYVPKITRQVDLAWWFGVSQSAISAALRGETW
jgi:hypothetical protein